MSPFRRPRWNAAKLTPGVRGRPRDMALAEIADTVGCVRFEPKGACEWLEKL